MKEACVRRSVRTLPDVANELGDASELNRKPPFCVGVGNATVIIRTGLGNGLQRGGVDGDCAIVVVHIFELEELKKRVSGFSDSYGETP